MALPPLESAPAHNGLKPGGDSVILSTGSNKSWHRLKADQRDQATSVSNMDLKMQTQMGNEGGKTGEKQEEKRLKLTEQQENPLEFQAERENPGRIRSL